MDDKQNVLSTFAQKKILVIGDIILDQYITGTVTRISPEAPVPVVLQQGAPHYTLGGAANVANNLSSLGAQVTLVGRIGNDAEAQCLKDILAKKGISAQGLVVDENFPTATKTRIIAHHQQVVRLDRERAGSDEYLASSKFIEDYVRAHLTSFDAVIISDYGKGVVVADIVHHTQELAAAHHIPMTVDPKVEHFGFYGKATAITPNRLETENALRRLPMAVREQYGITFDTLHSPEAIEKVGRAFLDYFDIESILITLGEQGMALFEQGQPTHMISTQAKEVYDVSGAGDTVISVFSLGLAAGLSKQKSADLANAAAGIVVGKMGAVAVSVEDLQKAVV